MTQRLRLYFVNHDDADGCNFDLFVWSETLDTVIDHWRRYFEFLTDDEPHRIFEIPTGSPLPGPIPWHSTVRCVLGDPWGPR